MNLLSNSNAAKCHVLIAATITLSLVACASPQRPSNASSASPSTLPVEQNADSEDEQEIRKLIANYGAAANARDLAGVMRLYTNTSDVLVYDVSSAPFRGFAEVTRDWKEFIDAMSAINLEFRDIEVTVEEQGDFAYATFIERASLTPTQGSALVNDNLRTTQIYKKVNGQWLIVHEHKSKSLNGE